MSILNIKGDESDEDDEDEERREPLGGASRISIRKWKKVTPKIMTTYLFIVQGNYTLLHDADTNERSSVDLFFHLLPKHQRGKFFFVKVLKILS